MLLDGMRLQLVVVLAVASCSGPTKPPATRSPPATAEPPAIPDDGTRLVVATGHQATLDQIVTTPDGRFIATLAHDRIARVFRADDLRELARFVQPGKRAYTIAIAPDGTRIAVAYRDDTVVFDVASGAELGRIPTEAGDSRRLGLGWDTCLVFDGRELLLWRDGLVRWSAGAQVARLSTSRHACSRMGFLGPTTLAFSDAMTVFHGELGAEGFTPAAVPAPPIRGWPVAFGRGVVAWAAPEGVHVWRTSEPTSTRLLGLGQYGEVSVVDDGAAVVHAVGGPAGSAMRIDVATGITSSFERCTEIAGLGIGRAVCADVAQLCITDGNGKRDTCLVSSTGAVRSLAVTQSGLLVVGAADAPLRAWSLRRPTQLRRYAPSPDPGWQGDGVVSSDGAFIAQVEDTGIIVRSLAGDGPRELRHAPQVGYSGVAITPDGAWIATISRQSVIRLRSDGSGSEEIQHVLPRRPQTPRFLHLGDPDAHVSRYRWRTFYAGLLAYRHDGAVLAASIDDTVVLLRDDKVIATLPGAGRSGPVTALAFRPGSSELAVGFFDGHVTSWDTDAPGSPLLDRRVGSAIAALGYDASGSTLLVSSDDARIRVFRASEAAAKQTLETHRTTALAVAFLANGRIATGHVDGAVRIWRLASSQLAAELYPLATHADGRDDWIVVGPDGRFETSIGDGGDDRGVFGVKHGQVVPFAGLAHRRRSGVLHAALSDSAR